MDVHIKFVFLLFFTFYFNPSTKKFATTTKLHHSSSAFKTKVEAMGETLKNRVVALKNVPQQQLDLVFLVDSSDSVGADNFNSELKFVHKLLADHTVSYNKTRVALVTFSSRSLVIRHIDHITSPTAKNNKCKMLTRDMSSISYSGGGTYTVGALMEAQKILETGRMNAARAVFLITDGYSNGGDPRFVATKLKSAGVQVFTFGILNGNVQELMDMASDPKTEHCYILDSFEEFEALARRALHQDLQVGDYEIQDNILCNDLCKLPNNDSGCCDTKAKCFCGTHIGHYECRCPVGYYGSGLIRDCLPCPAGTYGETEGLIDVTGCHLCPPQRNISETGSTSIHDCRCRYGYHLVNQVCVGIECIKLAPPINGYFVNNNCSNEFNSACGIRCNPGYKAVGSSIRLCGENGQWSGQLTQCLIKHCPSLKHPRHGSVTCDFQDFRFQARCNFTCDEGFTLIGSKSRQCLAISSWDGIPAHCRSISCPILTPPVNGSIIPSKCTQIKSRHGDTCNYSCKEGFILMGARKRQCNEKGKWTSADKKSICVDVTPPIIQCPNNMEVETDPNESFATVAWDQPNIGDNSGIEPAVITIPVIINNTYQFPIGSSSVTFVVEDGTNNKANCSFIVNVIDHQSPIADQCISPPIFLVSDVSISPVWEEPVFSDNSGHPVIITASHDKNSTFVIGITSVTYVASDISGNNSTCILNITLQEDKCEFPSDLINGHANCSAASIDGTICSLTCDEGYAFAFDLPTAYLCTNNGSWTPSTENNVKDCSVTSLPNEATENIIVTLQSENVPCDDAFFMHQVENKFQRKLDLKLDVYCHEDSASCDISYLTAACENNIDEQEKDYYLIRRRKSVANAKISSQLVAIRFQLNVSGQIDNDVEQNSSSKLFTIISSILNQMKKDAEKGELDLQMGNVHLTYNKLRIVRGGPSLVCPAGSVLRKTICVKCPVGTFYNVVSETCHGCSRGTYQFLEGQLSCLVCPNNTSTSSGQLAKSQADCKAQCLPGTFSSDGLEPCQTCKRGFYNPGYAQISCIKCPGEMTTNRRGARNHTKCRELCDENYVSQSGLKPCYECPTEYFQPERGMKSCYKCLQANCSKTQIIKEIELPINDCFSVPCFNGGTCRLISFGYVCDCPFGYTGMQCETNINDCANFPCKNSGQCIDYIGNFKCICQPGYSGVMCEDDIDDCDSNPCLNDGKCVDLANDYYCDCSIVYTGKNCESNIDECSINPCLNGGSCVQDIGGRRCICVDGFAGDDCQQKINICEEKPCLNSGLCHEDANDYFVCQCQDGFTGPICEINVDDCQSQPCTNGGTCVDKVNSYSCDCQHGFVGHQCQIKLSSNFVLRFQTSGISDYAQTEGFISPLPQVSFCLWLKNNDSLNYGTSISYAVDDVDNSLTLTDTNGLVFYVNGEKVITDITANDGQWHIICVTWSALNGSWTIYKDGVLSDYGSGLSVGRAIPKGGSLVIGQDQDKVNGGFSQAESFVGYLGWINFWDSILTENNIKTLMSTCGDYVGNVKSWPDFLSGVRGKVKLEEFHFCKGCGQPEDILNGKVTVNGSIARYYCNPGYTLLGKFERLCMIYGSWSIEKPECQRITCIFPGYIENGYMESNGFKFQDVIHFKCKDGYQLEGQQSRTCQNNGQWTGNNPECIEIHCPFLNPLDNGYLNYTSLKEFPTIATRVSFFCYDGFRLEGSPTSQCNADGFWDEDPPLCQPVYCTNPPKISNGFVNNNSINEISIGEHISFECDAGYRAPAEQNDSKMLCSEDSQWVGDIPLCVLLDCGQPPTFINMLLNVNETTYGHLANYSCLDGYKMMNSFLRCSESEKWVGHVSECLPVECPMLQSIRYGEFLVSSVKFNGIVTYSCMEGYVLKGNTTRRCLANGLWSSFPPICSRIVCPNPPILENGMYNQEELQYLPGFEITYSCNIGYLRIGPSKITCLDTGNWSDDFSNCQIVECPTPLVISNGVYTGTTFFFNSNISYSCDRGYTIKGDAFRICTESQTWSGDEPECRKVSCRSINNLKNGQVYFESFEYMSELHYLCNKGFKLQGPNVRTCLANGSWTDEEPECILNKCSFPEGLSNGQVITSDAILQYKCDDGYILKGDTQQFCETSDSSVWSGTPASCHPIRCRPPEVGLNVNAKVTNLNYGAVVEYDCLPGYKPTSIQFVKQANCQSDGSWSSASPNCEIKKCPKLNYLLNGKAMGSSIDVEAILQFECDSGYKMIGDKNIRCFDNETWSGELPKCVPITCPWPIPQLFNGFLYATGYAINDEVIYECKEGYEIVGGLKNRLCLADGTWTGNEPSCLPVNCGQPDISPDNVISVNQTTFGSIVFYKCSEGFQLIGESNRTCLSNRTWSSSAPKCLSLQCKDNTTCKKLSCGPPPTVKNGRFLNFTTTFVGGIVTYICDDGYMIEGYPTKKCDNSKKWLPYDYFPRCVRTECNALLYLQNGYYLYSATEIYVGSTVTAECETDFHLLGDKVRMCGSNGDWTGREAFCIRVECPSPPQVSHSSMEIDETIVGASIRYKCDKGYETNDNTVLTCMSNGHWNYEVPNCKAIQCPTPSPINNGTIKDLGHNFGNVIYSRCDIGHKIVSGSVERICQENGTWSGNDLICEPIICEPLGTPFNSVVTIYQNNSMQIAEYLCNSGYKLIGNAQRICFDDGRWSGKAPNCQIINCPAIKIFENGWIVMSDLKETTPFSFGTKITFTCYSNYVLNESISKPLECLSNGNWDRPIPACVRSKCDRWPLVADAVVTSNNSMSIGSIIQYKCRHGFQLVGISERQCLENGLWGGTTPKCVPVLCSQAPEIDNTATKLSIPDGQSRFSFGATITYSCKDGFELIGSAVLVCDAEGKWAGQWPTCNRTSCPSPPVIEHSTVQVENYEHLSRALYICEPGYVMKSKTENPVIHCLPSGEWEKQINMNCEPMKCNALPGISYGRYENTNQTNFAYGTIVRFNCIKGFRPTGNGKLVVKCLSNGQWLSKIPRCRPVTCLLPEQPLNSVINSDKTNIFGSTATYSCLLGFKLEGNSERMCQHDGRWSGEVPRCLKFNCPELEPPTNGFIMVNGSGRFGDVARFRCEKDYNLRGNNESVCGSDGQWTTKPPTCRGKWIIICNFPNFPTFTVVENKMKIEYNIGEKISYHCKNGYEDSKHAEGIATCQNDGNWTFTISSCQRVYCGPPVFIDNNVKLTESDAFYFEDKLSYSCLRNTFPKDSISEIICKADGSWSFTPTCEALCPSPCLNGGTCIGPKKCRCRAGFLGDLCQKAFCAKPCQNGGTCIAYNRCKCEHGFSGKYCEQNV